MTFIFNYERGVPICELQKMNVVRLKSGERLDFLTWSEDGSRFTALPLTQFAGPKVFRTRDIDRRYHGRGIKHQLRNPLVGIPLA